jgi:ribosomal protein S27E
MSDQHCPGFESNKSLAAVKVKCPECGKEQEIFSDEVGKQVKCDSCSAAVRLGCLQSAISSTGAATARSLFADYLLPQEATLYQ